MGRLMSPADYSMVAALLSVLAIISVPTGVINTVAMRYSAQYKAKSNDSLITKLQHLLSRKMFIFGIVLTGIMLISSPFIAKFLKLDSVLPVIVLSFVCLFIFTAPVYRGILQGLQKFKGLSISLVADSGIKFAAGVALVMAGFLISGAIGAVVLGAFVGLITAWFFLKKQKVINPEKNTKEQIDFRGMLKYAIPVAVVLLGTALFYNIDVILVKHYFSAQEAGYYASLSQLGKIIIFGTGAIAGVMFPMIVEKYEKGERYQGLFWKSIGIVTLLSGIALVIYFLFPEFVVGLLYGADYLPMAGLLGFVGIFMALYSILNVVVQFFLSVKSYTFLYSFIIGMIGQIILVVLFHNTIEQVILMMNISMASIAIALFIHYAFFNQKLKIKRKAVDSGSSL